MTITELPPCGNLHLFATQRNNNVLISAISSTKAKQFNMGADGGSIPDRRDLVKTKGKLEKTDKALLRERFFFCALSKVSCPSS